MPLLPLNPDMYLILSSQSARYSDYIHTTPSLHSSLTYSVRIIVEDDIGLDAMLGQELSDGGKFGVS